MEPTAVDRVRQEQPIDDQIVVVEDRDVPAHRPSVVEDVGANGWMLCEVGIQNLSERAGRHREIRALDVTTKCLGERDPHHEPNSRSIRTRRFPVCGPPRGVEPGRWPAILVDVTTTFDDFAELARSRRTHMLVDREHEVPIELIEQLCELGTWAPCHKKTWPWKFAIFTGNGRSRLGEAFVDDMCELGVGDEGKRLKTLTKYARTPATLVVGCEPHDHPTFHAENRDAVSAAIQNVLLGATAAGLSSFWSTAPIIDSPRALELCGFDPADRIIGIIYLGWPNATLDAPERPEPIIRHVAD